MAGQTVASAPAESFGVLRQVLGYRENRIRQSLDQSFTVLFFHVGCWFDGDGKVELDHFDHSAITRLRAAMGNQRGNHVANSFRKREGEKVIG